MVVSKEIGYNLEESKRRFSSLYDKLEEYILLNNEFIRYANGQFSNLDSRDSFLQNELDIISKRKQNLDDHYLNKMNPLRSENNMVTSLISELENKEIAKISTLSDSSSEFYKANQETFRMLSLIKFIAEVDGFSQFVEAVGTANDINGYYDVLKKTFIDKHSIKIVNGSVRYYGSNEVIKEIFGKNIRWSKVDIFTTKSFDMMKNDLFDSIKGIDGLLTVVNIGMSLKEHGDGYNINKDMGDYIANSVSSIYGHSAKLVAGSVTTSGVGWAMVTVTGFSNPVLVTVGAGVVMYFVVEPVIDWTAEKLNERLKEMEMNNVESKGKIDAINKLRNDGYKDVIIDQYVDLPRD